MEIYYHRNFNKAFLKLSPKMQEKVEETIESFQNDPHDPQLDNHALHGKQKGKRAISAGGDLRLIFQVERNYERVQFIQVGTHNQVYD